MRITELKSAEQVPINIEARKMLIRKECELIHLALKPGEVLDVHTNPFDVAFYTLAGTGELTIGEETKTIAPDSVIEVAAGEKRGWKNTGTEELRVLVLKVLITS
jgi:quercetin dioxygenase-like cupin family protein